MTQTPTHGTSDDAPDADAENVEEEFRSLMEGLRTTLPGVQLVTAFLLTVPLYEKYEALSRSQRSAYFLAFLSAVVVSPLLTAPSSHQRLRSDGGIARRHRRHLEVAVTIAVWGSVAFAVALTAASYLVASLVLDGTLAAVVALGVALVCGWSWYYRPFMYFPPDPVVELHGQSVLTLESKSPSVHAADPLSTKVRRRPPRTPRRPECPAHGVGREAHPCF